MAFRDTFLRNVEAALGMVDAARQEIAMRKQSREDNKRRQDSRADIMSRTRPPRDPASRGARDEALRRKDEDRREKEYARGRPNPADYADSPDLTKGPVMAEEEDFGEGLSEEELIADLTPRSVLREQTQEFLDERRDEGVKKSAMRFFGGSEMADTPGFYPQSAPGMEDDTKLPGPKSLAEVKSEQAAQPPKAVPVEPDEGKLKDYFRVATGTPFDGKSSRDVAYMEKIKRALRENPDLAELSPRQFAVKLYAMG